MLQRCGAAVGKICTWCEENSSSWSEDSSKPMKQSGWVLPAPIRKKYICRPHSLWSVMWMHTETPFTLNPRSCSYLIPQTSSMRKMGLLPLLQCRLNSRTTISWMRDFKTLTALLPAGYQVPLTALECRIAQVIYENRQPSAADASSCNCIIENEL